MNKINIWIRVLLKYILLTFKTKLKETKCLRPKHVAQVSSVGPHIGCVFMHKVSCR